MLAAGSRHEGMPPHSRMQTSQRVGERVSVMDLMAEISFRFP